MTNVFANTMLAFFIVALVLFVLNIVYSNEARRKNDLNIETWDNGLARQIQPPKAQD